MSSAVNKMLEFFILIGKLKNTKRTGWVLKGVQESESVADHMYRMAIMAMMFDQTEGVNRELCIKLALVHDLAECIVGDLTPHCGVAKEDKHRLEREALTHLCSLLTNQDTSLEIMDLYLQYEAQLTKEAKLVKDLDRFDMILQAFEYEKKAQLPKSLQEFFDSTEGQLEDSTVIAWKEELDRIRQNFGVEIENKNKE